MKIKNNVQQQFFIVKNKSEYDWINSQSGGAFRAIINSIADDNTVIYGCVLTENMKIEHIRSTNKEEISRMSGSKYVQSNLNNVFKQIKSDLEADKKVIFSGTPCQINGIKSYLEYLKVKSNQLICIDLICHGVPSPGVWEKYKKYLNEKNENVKNFNFRNKKYGWESSVATFESNGKEMVSNVYNILFFMHYIVRPSCFECPYRNLKRCGDITIGDAWGIKSSNTFYDNRGVSLVMINTKNGEEIFNKIKDKIYYEKVNIDEYIQPAISKNYTIPEKRKKFWNDYNKKKFSYIARKYGGENIISKIKRKVKKIINKLKRVF